MMTTDNSGSISEDELNHKDSPNNDNGKTQAQIDREQNLVKAEVPAPISESQVQPGREVVDGNGLRETPDVEATRPDIIVDKDVDTQAKRDAEQREHAQTVQDKQNKKLDTNKL